MRATIIDQLKDIRKEASIRFNNAKEAIERKAKEIRTNVFKEAAEKGAYEITVKPLDGDVEESLKKEGFIFKTSILGSEIISIRFP